MPPSHGGQCGGLSNHSRRWAQKFHQKMVTRPCILAAGVCEVSNTGLKLRARKSRALFFLRGFSPMAKPVSRSRSAHAIMEKLRCVHSAREFPVIRIV